MKTSCISHPEREPLAIIRKWQLAFCEGNHCAAATLAYFEYWHNWKLDSDDYHRKMNNVAEAHGDARTLSEDVLQYHTHQEISDGILNLYGVKAIADAIKILEAKGVIAIHANPNPKYRYDKTRFFSFHPEVCQAWLDTHYKPRAPQNTTTLTPKGICETVKKDDRESEKGLGNGENTLAITEIKHKGICQISLLIINKIS